MYIGVSIIWQVGGIRFGCHLKEVPPSDKHFDRIIDQFASVKATKVQL